MFNEKPMSAEMRKLVAAVARAQGGDVVDLPQIERDVRIAVPLALIDYLWERLAVALAALEDAGKDPAKILRLTEAALQSLESELDAAIISKLLRPPSIAEMQNAQPAEHRAARGVRKVRGAK